MLWYELTRWWAYRTINHPKMAFYVWKIPLLMAAAACAFFAFLPVRPPLAGQNGLLASLLQVLGLLPGFFITALAAVATFDRPEMDQTMPAPTPKVQIFRSGEWIDIELTRRIFLTYLFSYLSVISLVVISMCIGAIAVAPSLAKILPTLGSCKHAVKETLTLSFFLLLSYLIASILITTLHGIYFLMERIHQPH